MCEPTECDLWKIREGLRTLGVDKDLLCARILVLAGLVDRRHAADELNFVDRMLAAKCPCDEGDETNE